MERRWWRDLHVPEAISTVMALREDARLIHFQRDVIRIEKIDCPATFVRASSDPDRLRLEAHAKRFHPIILCLQIIYLKGKVRCAGPVGCGVSRYATRIHVLD